MQGDADQNEHTTPSAVGWSFVRISPDGDVEAAARELPVEAPIAVEFNGFGYAVLMATPDDLADLAYGFALSERLIDKAADITDLVIHPVETGTLARIFLRAERASNVIERVRHRVSDSSCGLCSIENLEQALRPLPPMRAKSGAKPVAIFRALAALSDRQPLNRATGTVHAAACCASDGDIRLVREDVGRHNAFDKLIGAMLRDGLDWDGGFALLTSRCSFELVEKAVLAGCPLLATISAPTSLAAERARAAGLDLAVLARSDSMLMHGAPSHG